MGGVREVSRPFIQIESWTMCTKYRESRAGNLFCVDCCLICVRNESFTNCWPACRAQFPSSFIHFIVTFISLSLTLWVFNFILLLSRLLLFFSYEFNQLLIVHHYWLLPNRNVLLLSLWVEKIATMMMFSGSDVDNLTGSRVIRDRRWRCSKQMRRECTPTLRVKKNNIWF